LVSCMQYDPRNHPFFSECQYPGRKGGHLTQSQLGYMLLRWLRKQ
jgi:hypothetical protein